MTDEIQEREAAVDEIASFLGQKAAEPSARIRNLADRFHQMKIVRDAATDTLKRAQEEYDRAEADLFDALEDAGLQSVRTPAGLFGLNDLAWPRIEDRERLMAWAEHERPELLTLNLQRLQTPLREALRDGVELPPGLGYTTTRKIRHTPPRG